MRRFLILIALLPLFVLQADALDLQAPEVPDSGKSLMPYETESFAEGMWSVITAAISELHPEIASAIKTGAAMIGMSVLLSIFRLIPGCQERVAELVGVVSVTLILMGSSSSMIRLAAETVSELTAYGKLLFPVLTTALAAQGGATTSAALYAGTLAFDTILGSLLYSVITPLVYIFLCFCLLHAATGQELLGKLRDLCKWMITWSLKTVLYVFTGYMGITGVVSGSTDAAALKATKITISGMVPVVGGILSDTSEAVLVSAGVVKNAIGVYGMISVMAVWISPFLRIGIQYILLKCCHGICCIFPSKQTNGLIQNFGDAMGILLAMTGCVCLFLMISVICFMKGVG